MEINDGGAAETEFTSDEEDDIETTADESELSGQDDTDGEHESGEIESNDSESEEGQQSVPTSPLSTKRKKMSKEKLSAGVWEDHLDTMSSTLLAMKELLMKNGMEVSVSSDGKIQHSKPKAKQGSQ